MASTRVQDRNWEALKPAQQRRYLNAGVTKESYLAGASLKKARGHAKRERPPKNRPPKKAWEAAQEHHATLKQLDALRKWQREDASKWLRNPVFSEDTAANLSTIDLTPRNWKSVDIYPRRDGTYEVYIESAKGGPIRSATLTSLDEVRELQDAVAFKNAGQFDEDRYAQWDFDDWDVDEVSFYDTDEAS